MTTPKHGLVRNEKQVPDAISTYIIKNKNLAYKGEAVFFLLGEKENVSHLTLPSD